MSIAVPYNCKVCAQPRTAQADDDAPKVWIAKLAKLLTCDPCYRFIDRRRKAHDWIAAWAMQVGNIRAVNHDKDQENVKVMLEPIRAKLVSGTKRLAEIVCRHYRHAYTWEFEFVDLIMDDPDKCRKILRGYESQIKRQALRQ